MVTLLIVFCLTLLNVADSLVGLVREPMAEERMFRRSSSSARFRILTMLPPCLTVCFFTVSHGGSISAFKQVPKPTLISALKKKLRREYNLRSVNLRCSKACKPNSNSNALSILSLDDVALDYDGAIKTYTGSGTDLVIGMEGAALYASSPNALEVLLGEALAKTWANRYNKNTDIVL